MNTQPIPILLQLMFGEAAPVSLESASERLLAWAQAFDEWLETRKSNKNMYNASHLAWKQILALVRKPPWAMTREDMELYQAWLQERKLAQSTIRHQFVHISTFYGWCSQKAIDPLTGPSFNPAAGICQHQKAYSKAQALSMEESTALLRLLKNDEWLLSKRD